MRIIFHSHESTFRICHLAEIIFHEFGKVARWLDGVERAKAGGFGGIGTACIAVGGLYAVGCCGVGSFLACGEIASAGGESLRAACGVVRAGCEIGAIRGEGGWWVRCVSAGFIFALGAEGFCFQAGDFLVVD